MGERADMFILCPDPLRSLLHFYVPLSWLLLPLFLIVGTLGLLEPLCPATQRAGNIQEFTGWPLANEYSVLLPQLWMNSGVISTPEPPVGSG